jgi:LPPG:FO 2-phospho-L-lactate transferase
VEGRVIIVLTGGTGGAKFVDGLRRVLPPQELTIIVNTGDDFEWWGLHISPDLDSITYVLADLLSKDRGWGVDGDTFQCLDAMRRLGQPAWFQIGDKDLATHLFRTQLLHAGKTLTEATAEISRGLGIEATVLPMSDCEVETRVTTAHGEIGFQDYFVKRRCKDQVISVRFAGAEQAKPANGVIEAILKADTVFFAPSNPITSIGPILAVPGIRDALRQTEASVVAVSPMVGDGPVSGPAGALMTAHGFPVSIIGVAQVYQDFLDVLIADSVDEARAVNSRESGLQIHCMNTIMKTVDDRTDLARAVLALVTNVKKYPVAS